MELKKEDFIKIRTFEDRFVWAVRPDFFNQTTNEMLKDTIPETVEELTEEAIEEIPEPEPEPEPEPPILEDIETIEKVNAALEAEALAKKELEEMRLLLEKEKKRNALLEKKRELEEQLEEE